MIHPSLKKIQHFQDTVLSWYAEHRRDLPWRKTTNPYHIRVSEIMLQQTQVDRVIPKYLHFLDLFPTIQGLAQAEKQLLLQAWSGLGYNSRAMNMQKAAQEVVETYQGIMPDTPEGLRKLPGIGPYTSGAICAFSYNKVVPVVDINIKRVLIHTFGLPENISMQDLEILAVHCVPKGKSCIWHNALMDYGSLVLHSKKTGIKSAKQSTFHGSTRWVRGNLMKHLTKFGPISVEDAKKKLHHEEFDAILAKMLKEGIVKVKDGMIML